METVLGIAEPRKQTSQQNSVAFACTICMISKSDYPTLALDNTRCYVYALIFLRDIKVGWV